MSLTEIVTRGVVKLVRETLKLRGVQVSLVRSGETEPETEHFEPAGLTASPLAGAEALVAHLGGDSDHPVVIVVTDRRHRPLDLASGEVVIYAPTTGGKQVRLTATTIKLGAGATKAVARVGDAASSGPGDDAVLWAWIAGVDAVARAIDPLLPAAPTTATSTILTGSAVVKAVD